MSLIAKKKSQSNIPPLESGTYTGVCVGVIDLGEQYNQNFKTYSQKVMLIYEIIGETVEADGEDKPRWLSKEYSKSINIKSDLYRHASALAGRDITNDDEFDITQLIGAAGLIAVDEKQSKTDPAKFFNYITQIVALPKGMPMPKAQSETLLFDIDSWDDTVLVKIPEWIRDRIMKSTEYVKAHSETADYRFDDKSEDEAAFEPEKADVKQISASEKTMLPKKADF